MLIPGSRVVGVVVGAPLSAHRQPTTASCIAGTIPHAAQFRGIVITPPQIKADGAGLWLELLTGLGYIPLSGLTVHDVTFIPDPSFGWLTLGELLVASLGPNLRTSALVNDDMTSAIRGYLTVVASPPRIISSIPLTSGEPRTVSISRLPSHCLGQNSGCSVRYGIVSESSLLVVVKCFDVGNASALREAAILKRVARHPNIVNVVPNVNETVAPTCCPEGHMPERAITMEVVPGVSCSELVSIAYPLTTAEVTHVATELLRALAYLHHDCAVVHGDIAPQNIFVTFDGHVKLIDFGGAALFDHASGDVVEAVTPGHIGTPGFNLDTPLRRTSDARTNDVYGAGATLAFLTLGPTFDPSTFRTALEIAAADAARPAQAQLTALLLDLTHPDPSKRPRPSQALLHASMVPTCGWSSGQRSLENVLARRSIQAEARLRATVYEVQEELVRFSEMLRDRQSAASVRFAPTPAPQADSMPVQTRITELQREPRQPVAVVMVKHAPPRNANESFKGAPRTLRSGQVPVTKPKIKASVFPQTVSVAHPTITVRQ